MPPNADGRETVKQLQLILELLDQVDTEVLNTYSPGIEAFLEGRFLPAAQDGWKKTPRYEQARQYIQWLRET